jgi:SAM-dependent methyltransferase
LTRTSTSNPGWPFWAPTSGEEIERALALAELKPGELLLDLGCGDGRVLEAAARRGARVIGYESDPALAGKARALLSAWPQANVVAGDFFTLPVDADVVFAYLSPAMLWRLRPRLEGLRRGGRVVTVHYRIAGWEPTRSDGRTYLYTLPADKRQSPPPPGWGHAGLILALPPGLSVLIPLVLGTNPGPVNVELDSDLGRVADARPGADYSTEAAGVPVDVRFKPMRDGTAVVGDLAGVTGGTEHRISLAAVSTAASNTKWFVAASSLGTLRGVIEEIRAGRRPVEYLFAAIAAGSNAKTSA